MCLTREPGFGAVMAPFIDETETLCDALDPTLAQSYGCVCVCVREVIFLHVKVTHTLFPEMNSLGMERNHKPVCSQCL